MKGSIQNFFVELVACTRPWCSAIFDFRRKTPAVERVRLTVALDFPSSITPKTSRDECRGSDQVVGFISAGTHRNKCFKRSRSRVEWVSAAATAIMANAVTRVVLRCEEAQENESLGKGKKRRGKESPGFVESGSRGRKFATDPGFHRFEVFVTRFALVRDQRQELRKHAWRNGLIRRNYHRIIPVFSSRHISTLGKFAERYFLIIIIFFLSPPPPDRNRKGGHFS